MAIPPEFLTGIFGAAPCILNYGGPGMRKTNMIATLPPPVLMHDIEQGGYSLLPWTRRWRNWNSTSWVDVSDVERLKATSDLLPEIKTVLRESNYPRPMPLIDIIRYNNMEPEAFDTLGRNIIGFNTRDYNSLAVDSLQDVSFHSQIWSKSMGQVDTSLIVMQPMHVKWWTSAQSRMELAVRKMKNYASQGCVVYLTAGEIIDKDYITDPRETPSGQKPQEPYSIKGTMNLPGKLPGAVSHISDIQLHSRVVNGAVTCFSRSETISVGDAVWEAKDRYGRLTPTLKPNVRIMFELLIGKESTDKIYTLGVGNA